jgi:hypothetical protein
VIIPAQDGEAFASSKRLRMPDGDFAVGFRIIVPGSKGSVLKSFVIISA